jgi:hypothetical protein
MRKAFEGGGEYGKAYSQTFSLVSLPRYIIFRNVEIFPQKKNLKWQNFVKKNVEYSRIFYLLENEKFKIS